MNAYFHLPCFQDLAEPASELDLDEILQSADSFLGFLGQRFSDEHLDPELETHAYAYLVDPPSMHKMITTSCCSVHRMLDLSRPADSPGRRVGHRSVLLQPLARSGQW
jgi:hypothetical protein